MCITKLDPKTLDKIVKEALEAEKKIEERVIRSYSVAYQVKHYEEINGYNGGT